MLMFFYADNRVDRSRVRLSTEKSGTGGQDVLIRIRTTAPIDEPVVTLYLRTGCSQKIEKRYVVLADVLSEAALGSTAALPLLPGLSPQAPGLRGVPRTESAGVSSPAPGTAQNSKREALRLAQIAKENQRLEAKNRAAAAKNSKAAAAADAGSTANTGQGMPAAIPAPGSPENAPAIVQTPKTDKKALVSAAKPTSTDAPKPRLKLEPAELLAERDPMLKPSAELRSAPSNDPAQRLAAAALWRAIAAQPEDILGDSQKLKSLESAVSGLQAQMKKNQLDMQSLGGTIEKAQTEKYANPLVFGLGFLLLLAALGLILALRKRTARTDNSAAVQPWWRKGSGERVGWADSAQNLQSSAASSASPYESALDSGAPAGSNSDQASSAHYLDLDLSDVAGKSPSQFEKPGREHTSLLASPSRFTATGISKDPTLNLRAEFTHSATSAERAVKAEELFDVQQQADFFVSLGQKDQAIEVLRSHIEESEETSALVYLDLLKLYHELDEQLEFEAFRQEFNARFNAEMPEFEAYSQAASSAGLQAYPLAMSRIVALWPSAKVLNVIEESMFREPDSRTPTFDIEAYRELLLLYAMIKDILHAQSVGKSLTPMPVLDRFAADRRGDLNHSGGQASERRSGRNSERSSGFAGTAIVPLTAMPARQEPSANLKVRVDIDVDISNFGQQESAGAELTKSKLALLPGAGVTLPQTVPGKLLNASKTSPTAPENSIDFDFDIDQPASADLPFKKPSGGLPRTSR